MIEKKQKIRFLGGWEIYFENMEPTIEFLKTHGVDKEGFMFFKEVQSALEFEIEGNKLIKGYKHHKDIKELKWQNVNLPISDWTDHKVFLLEKDPKGAHRIGGSIPQELILPEHPELTTMFQYIGTLDCTDPYFNWLNMEKLHVVFPVNECYGGIYLDYSNPSKPQLIEDLTNPDDWYESTDEGIQIEYSQVNFKTTNVLDVSKFNNRDALLCGVPLWYQFPHVPKCPITNEPMRFICSIESDKDIRVVNKERERDDILIFEDMGHLMLFYHPVTKILFANVEH